MSEYDESKESSVFEVNDSDENFSSNLHNRLLSFSINTIRYLSSVPRNKEYDVFRVQLSRSVTSIGANYEEARGASSRRDFTNKLAICLKESRESFYWFSILQELEMGNQDTLKLLRIESSEILKIFVTSVKTAKSR